VAEALVIGIGNPFRRDDGAGPIVAEKLARHGVDARVHSGDGADLIDQFALVPRVVLVDATRSDAIAGTLSDFDALQEALPKELFNYSTHLFGLAEAVETARVLGLLPRALRVIGIEGKGFGPGEGLSPPVAAAVEDLVSRLSAELKHP